MKLISELCEDLQYIVEEKDGRKFLYVEGPYISVNTPNRNNRVYPKGVMEPVVESYIRDKVSQNVAYGQFGHPSSPKIEEEKISHRITSLKWDGNSIVGKAIVLPEGAGKIMAGIIESGGRLGMSTRGMGSVKANDNGLNEVQNDYRLVCVDSVIEPSGINCWVNGIMEGVEYIWDASKETFMESRVDSLRASMKKLSNRELNERKLFLFEQYLKGISRK